MQYNYGECSTCARRGDPYCVGCKPMMASDGTYSRSLYTPRDTITFPLFISTITENAEKKDNKQ